MDSPETWRWIWLAAAFVFAAGEMASPGEFFLMPFAVGSLVAMILSFAGVSVTVSLVVFLVVSGATFAALRPLAHRLDRQGVTEGIGSKRLIGQEGVVTQGIPGGGHDSGMVKVLREEWRAVSLDGVPIEEGVMVKVIDIQGTHAVVWPKDLPRPDVAAGSLEP
ncbi:MAG: hypothetical protein JJLCMIEE_01352 [Acidimicrobiales bacterium]|nr:MAG: NfeD family protein [Actinomycetota bacterium]MBV6508292.1 hypothetical protein [Acidimicrobiales bacterium]RIK07076.1 MAG: NfeD family protein [Acidobacteriota bacterium]